jgi:hypothetical protein
MSSRIPPAYSIYQGVAVEDRDHGAGEVGGENRQRLDRPGEGEDNGQAPHPTAVSCRRCAEL